MDICDNRPLWKMTLEPVVGDHGEAYSPTRPVPAVHTAMLTCGCSLQFPVAPITGEQLWCGKHQDWYTGRTVGGYVVRCLSCNRPDKDGFDLTGRAHTWAIRHAYGKNGDLNPPHIVRVGRYTLDGIEWLAEKGRQKRADLAQILGRDVQGALEGREDG